jgi:membrane protease YdiL (CAAX protease family)
MDMDQGGGQEGAHEILVADAQPRVNAPGALEGMAIVAAAMLLNMLFSNLFALLHFGKRLASAFPSLSSAANLILVIASVFTVLALLLIYLFKVRRFSPACFGLTTDAAALNSLRGIAYSIGAAIAGVILTLLLIYYAQKVLVVLGWSQGDITDWFKRTTSSEIENTKLLDSHVGYILAVAMAPVFEELLFRGVLFKSLRRTVPFWAAACISSALFTALHFYIVGALMIFILGFVSAYALERHKSIVPCIVMHIIWNLRVVLFLIWK